MKFKIGDYVRISNELGGVITSTHRDRVGKIIFLSESPVPYYKVRFYDEDWVFFEGELLKSNKDEYLMEVL